MSNPLSARKKYFFIVFQIRFIWRRGSAPVVWRSRREWGQRWQLVEAMADHQRLLLQIRRSSALQLSQSARLSHIQQVCPIQLRSPFNYSFSNRWFDHLGQSTGNKFLSRQYFGCRFVWSQRYEKILNWSRDISLKSMFHIHQDSWWSGRLQPKHKSRRHQLSQDTK